ncbi:MAG: hypothetical protein CM1200mP26_00200 [Acidimicrobiales bacterium]|nr:MAG: hypothetical protein CM1200mP26_00200 [Acidimicrobiales bacterium]
MDCHKGSVKGVRDGYPDGARSATGEREKNTHMTTNETYIARLRKLISEAPDGLDVGPLEVALASAEAALASWETPPVTAPKSGSCWTAPVP